MPADIDRPLHISMAGAIGHDHSAARPHHFDAPRAAGSVDNRSAAVGPNHRGMARRRKARGTAVGAVELGAGAPARVVRTETPTGIIVRVAAPACAVVRDSAPAGVVVRAETPAGIIVRSGAPTGIVVRKIAPAGVV